MARFLDLPSEVLQLILEYLVNLLEHRYESTQFWNTFDDIAYLDRWQLTGASIRWRLTQRLRRPSQDISSCMKVCHQLYAILRPILYRNPIVNETDYSLIERSISEHYQDLAPYVRGFTVVSNGSIADVRSLFFLPNLTSLTICNFNDQIGHDWRTPNSNQTLLAGTSSLRTLTLVSCGAREAFLAELFSWPAQLKDLYFQVKHRQWTKPEVPEDPSWNCEALVRALDRQNDHLERLTLTGTALRGFFLSEAINLKAFSHLRHLRIFWIFLCGYFHPRFTQILPDSIETLEIHVDDAAYSAEAYLLPRLPELVYAKETDLTTLSRIYITAQEPTPINFLTIPQSLQDQCTSAGIDIRVQFERTFFTH